MSESSAVPQQRWKSRPTTAGVEAGTQRVSDLWSGNVALDGETFNVQLDGCVSRSRCMGIRVGGIRSGM